MVELRGEMAREIGPSYNSGDQRFTTVIHRDLAEANIPPEQGYCPFRMVWRRPRSAGRRTTGQRMPIDTRNSRSKALSATRRPAARAAWPLARK